jgi:PAT family beta-lactamase induction signal transducer AmpG
LTVSGIDLRAIGALSLLGLPYTLKFLWAPLLDRYALGWPGRRRDWILLMQAALVAVLVAVGMVDLAQQAWVVIVFAALAIATLSATQDLAIDAYRTEVLPEPERGLGAAMSVAGYRIGMLLAGAGALVLADRMGFGPVYVALGGVLGLATLASVLGPSVPVGSPPPVTLASAYREPLREFAARPAAFALFGFIVLYKLGDALAGTLTTPFLLRGLGFSLTEVGAINKGMGFVATILGALAGGAWMVRVGLYRGLWWFAVLQAVTNLGFAALALAGPSLTGMMAVIALENLSGGMGTSAFVALLMALCHRSHTATQFAIFSALASLPRVFGGVPAAAFADSMGWLLFFAATFVLALPALFLLSRQRAIIDALDRAPVVSS